MEKESGIKRVLVVGGGFAGMTAALELRRIGVDVELVELDQNWRTEGAGISLHGATLRVFERIGILDRFLELGATTEGVDMRVAADDSVLMTIPTHRLAPHLAGGGAVMRPVLASIMREQVRAVGVNVRLGVTFTEMTESAEEVTVASTDGSSGRYDLVVGADGLRSSVRAAVFPGAPEPRFIGQAVWRATAPRPKEIERPTMWIQGTLKAGVNVVAAEQIYLFLTENRSENVLVARDAFLPALRELLAQFPSPILSSIREGLGEQSQIDYRPLEQFLLPKPWYRGRVVLIGDAVHATTPHLAAGACIGVEDAVVLGESIAAGGSLEHSLSSFQDRRWERCQMVVQNSGRLAEIEVSGGDRAEHAEIMRTSMAALAQPI